MTGWFGEPSALAPEAPHTRRPLHPPPSSPHPAVPRPRGSPLLADRTCHAEAQAGRVRHGRTRPGPGLSVSAASTARGTRRRPSWRDSPRRTATAATASSTPSRHWTCQEPAWVRRRSTDTYRAACGTSRSGRRMSRTSS